MKPTEYAEAMIADPDNAHEVWYEVPFNQRKKVQNALRKRGFEYQMGVGQMWKLLRGYGKVWFVPGWEIAFSNFEEALDQQESFNSLQEALDVYEDNVYETARSEGYSWEDVGVVWDQLKQQHPDTKRPEPPEENPKKLKAKLLR